MVCWYGADKVVRWQKSSGMYFLFHNSLQKYIQEIMITGHK